MRNSRISSMFQSEVIWSMLNPLLHGSQKRNNTYQSCHISIIHGPQFLSYNAMGRLSLPYIELITSCQLYFYWKKKKNLRHRSLPAADTSSQPARLPRHPDKEMICRACIPKKSTERRLSTDSNVTLHNTAAYQSTSKHFRRRSTASESCSRAMC